ncbi:hypothetical protein PG989_014468 [Apiospora arundinis]
MLPRRPWAWAPVTLLAITRNQKTHVRACTAQKMEENPV